MAGNNTLITGPEIGMDVPVQLVKAFLSETLGIRETPWIGRDLAAVFRLPGEQKPGDSSPNRYYDH